MSTREKRRRAAGLLLIALFLFLCSTPQFRTFVAFPDHVRLAQGQTQDLTFRLPFRATVYAAGDGALALNGEPLGAQGSQAVLSTPLRIDALETGRSTVDFRLFGLIPFRRLTVDVVPEIRVVPGGHSIGVLLKSRGVIVVGFAAIRDQDGVAHQPGMETGIQVGDTILKINGREVTSEEQAARLFEEAGGSGKPVKVTVKRKDKVLTYEITPVREKESGRWRVGLYIRDGAAGVGTLTFYEPKTGTFGALGHMITDGGTNQPIEVKNGYIVPAEVTSIQKGRRGVPGEKIGSFSDEDNWLGVITKNSRFGIFGTLNEPVANPFYRETVPVAMAGQVKEGPAEILTVVEGQKMERFAVEIQRVIPEPTADGKNMVIKITDERLLEKTGGIVQGMSGSPILQDGRMVGAITHVFVNDPTRGYGALIEWMLQEAGLLPAENAGVREENPPGLLLYA